MSSGLRGRLARTLGLTAALSVLVTALISFGLVRRFAEQNAVRQLNDHADAVAADSEALAAGRAAALRRLLRASGDEFALVGPRGRFVAEDAQASAVANAIDLRSAVAGSRVSGRVRTSSGTYVYVAEPVSAPTIAAVVLARPVGLARDVWGPVLWRVLIAGAAAVAIAIAASLWLSRRMTEPLRHVADATGRVAAGDLTQRVPVEGDDEIADVARRFNFMADSLAEARRHEQEFLASVSHELRTPITAIRGYAEAIYDGAVAGEGVHDAVTVIQDEAARLERLVQDVMDLARLGARDFRLEPSSVDLAATVRDAVKAFQARSAEAGVSVVADAPSPVPCMTDGGRVRQIVTNLVENALRVTPSGGEIRVVARVGPVIEVSDTGPGIAPEDVPHVFERAYLWSRSKGVRQVGTGLGLAIVRELAAALGGRVEVFSVPGRGTTFRLGLPV